MRIFLTVFALFTGMMATVHVFVMFVVGGFSRSSSIGNGVGTGLLMLVLWGVATALVYPYPRQALIPFAIAGLLGILGGQNSPFSDLTLWGITAIVFAGLSYYATREKEQADLVHRAREQESEELREALRDYLGLPHGLPIIVGRSQEGSPPYARPTRPSAEQQ